jgi:hypothetical protein
VHTRAKTISTALYKKKHPGSYHSKIDIQFLHVNSHANIFFFPALSATKHTSVLKHHRLEIYLVSQFPTCQSRSKSYYYTLSAITLLLLSIPLEAYLSICLSIYLSIILFIILYHLKHITIYQLLRRIHFNFNNHIHTRVQKCKSNCRTNENCSQ